MKTKRIDELFRVMPGNKFDFGKMTIKADGLAFISRTSQNNGVVGYVEEISGVKPFSDGLITVSLGGTYVLSCFIQPQKFYTAQNVAVLEPLIDMSIQQKLYYCKCISMNRYRYSAFGREANRTLRQLLIPDVTEIPDWVDRELPCYMDFSKQFENKSYKLDTSEWKEFKYEDIFIIERGMSDYLQDMRNGPIPYVSASSGNNGITAFVDRANTEGDIIVLNYDGSIGEAFFHEYPVFASEKVVTIKLKNHNLNKYIAMFLITLIKQEKFRYNYGLKWSVNSRMKDSIIKLPVKSDGSPDFEFMEKYIKSLKYSKSI